MKIKKPTSPRPYWHVDAKWIAGLILTLTLTLTLISYNLNQVTEEKIITETISSGIQALMESETPPKEEEIALLNTLTTSLYEKGPQALDELEVDDETKTQLAPLITVTGGAKAINEITKTLTTVLAIISGVFLILLVLFSKRFGRLGSPGIVLFASTFALTLASTIGLAAADAGKSPIIKVLKPIIEIVFNNYFTLTITALGMIMIALFGGIIWRLTHKFT
ncbi:MAG: hypothetical protein V1679_02770 [Candidatus Peregrinibacteria bacterium]